MFRLLAILFLLFFLVLAFPQERHLIPSYLEEYKTIDTIFRKAEQISSQPSATAEQEEAMNRKALDGFRKILPRVEQAKDDSLAFHCYFKIAVLEHYFDSVKIARQHYKRALAIQSRVPAIPDSFLFKLYLYIGGIQYNSNQFDSALVNYKKAEQIAAEYSIRLDGTNRLFNTLGAMYYETGNYSRAKNYFEKAIALLGYSNNANEGLLINYRINLAATLTRLEDFDAANSIYEELLKQDINKNDILHNLGNINLRLGSPGKAIRYFKQVSYSNNRITRLMNDIGQAYQTMEEPDSALHYYQLATAENEKWNGRTKNVQAALTAKYLGDLDYANDKPREALSKYQQSIIQLLNGFNSTDIYQNPAHFNDAFSYINLFNVLTAKADAFEKLYEKGKKINDLQEVLDAYQAAFHLADFVEQTYESDEARLFLNKIKYTAHSKPIDASLLLYDLTGKKEFLEDAYFFDQKNKASILSLNIRENELRNSDTVSSDLFRKESNARSAITRLSLKASQTTDSVTLSGINSSIRDYEIELSKLQEQINADPVYREKQLTAQIPPINELQKKLDNSTALLSYHLSGNRLVTLLVTAGNFAYTTLSIDTNFYAQIDSFKVSLNKVSGEERYSGSQLAGKLYQKLILPVYPQLSNINRLIIIPDDELNYLPFEALEDEQRQYVVEKFAVQYQYSTALPERKIRSKENSTLVFAPFISKGFTDSTGLNLNSLPASGSEINDLEGEIFTDSAATKKKFLASANHYAILHLATHASVNNEMPLRSFISFYPGNDNDYKLYAGEIYNMDLDSTQLVILSACETGTGKLVKGEGLMSLSRAFAYAGCPNIITSLWTAEDKTTAFITKRVHVYLEKGFSNDKALQQAKLDLLRSAEVDPRFKTPNYWAHLIFIGQYEPHKKTKNWWWIAGVIVFIIVVYFVATRRKSG